MSEQICALEHSILFYLMDSLGINTRSNSNLHATLVGCPDLSLKGDLEYLHVLYCIFSALLSGDNQQVETALKTLPSITTVQKPSSVHPHPSTSTGSTASSHPMRETPNRETG